MAKKVGTLLEHPIDISVVVVTYCHERYIATSLDSILAQQTNLKYEILVGDDASSDQTPEIIRDYAVRYPNVIRPFLRQKNLGASRNIWELFQHAKGRYIAILEGDDYWADVQKLQKQWEFLEHNESYSGCCGKCLVVDENDHPDYTQSPQFVWNKKIFTMEDYLSTWKLPCQVGSLMFRNRYAQNLVWKDPILYTAHRNVTDKTLLLLLLCKGPIYCSNEILSCYRYVTQKDGKNFFSMHYANPYRNYDMFMYPCRLETWIRKHLRVKRHIGPRREYRFCRFVEESVREPSAMRIKCVLNMIMHSHQPARYLWCVLRTLIEMEEEI